MALLAAAGGLMALKPSPLSWPKIETTPALGQEAGAIAYYQHPDGLPAYSLTPAKTPDGRDYRAVPTSADIKFDLADDPPATATPPSATKRRRRTPALLNRAQ